MSDSMLVDAADDVFSDLCTHEAVQEAERLGWAEAMWTAVADMGLPWVGVPETAGGQGGSLLDALRVLRVAGRHALPLPLAETGVLGGWLLAGAGLPVPPGPTTVVPVDAVADLRFDGRVLSGTALRVPWARRAEQIVALVRADGAEFVAAVAGRDVRIEHATNVAGEPRDTVHLDGVAPVSLAAAGAGVDADALRLRGALTRVALIAGALERVQRITVDYTSQREQFGRALHRFQAIQEHLVLIAQQVAVVGTACEVAAREAERGAASVEIACAKALAEDAVRIATRSAHQAHGAMGMTQEYALHQFTRRLWSWRLEYGDGTFWSDRLGRLVAQRGADALYPLVTAGSAALTR